MHLIYFNDAESLVKLCCIGSLMSRHNVNWNMVQLLNEENKETDANARELMHHVHY